MTVNENVRSAGCGEGSPPPVMTRSKTQSRDGTLALEMYVSEIGSDGILLTAADECRLSREVKLGDKEARTKMIESNLRLVIKIARDYLGRGLSLDDLVGEGNLGLIRAVEDFDSSYGTRFSTYASYWIKQSIRHALTNTTAVIRLPAHTVGLVTKWRRADRALARELGYSPTHDEISAYLNFSDSQRALVEQALRSTSLRYEQSSADDEVRWSLEETADDRSAPEDSIELEDQCRDLRHRMGRLDERERTIVSLRYGLGGVTPLTLKEVGKRLGVTREWVRKIEVRAVKKLEDGWIPAPAKQKPARKTRRRSRAGLKRPLRLPAQVSATGAAAAFA